MFVIPTVLAGVAFIFAWIIGYQNGGILNVIAIPSEGVNSSILKIEPDMQKLMQYAASIAFNIGEMPLTILELMPTAIGGGQQGVAKAKESPNHEAVFLTAPIVILLLMTIALLGLFLINIILCCCCCCCRHPRRSKDTKRRQSFMVFESSTEKEPNDTHNYWASFDEESLNFEVLDTTKRRSMMKSTFLKEKQGFICCCCHIATIVLSIAYAVSLIFSLCFYFAASGEVITVLQAHNESTEEVQKWIKGQVETISIGRSLQFGLTNVGDFLKEGVQSGEIETNVAISQLNGIMQGNLGSGVTDLMRTLINDFKISKVIVDGITETTLINNVSIAMKYITDNSKKTSDLFADLKTKFSNLNKKIQGCCSVDLCQPELTLASNSLLLIEVFPNYFPTIPVAISGSMETAAKKTNQITDQLQEIKKDIAAMEDKVLQTLTEKVNLTAMLESLPELWKEMNIKAKSLSTRIDESTKGLPSAMEKYASYVKIVLYVIGGLLAIIALAILVCVLLLIVEAFRRRLFTVTGKSASIIGSNDPRRPRSRVCRSCCFCCSSICLLLFFLIFAVLSTLVLFVTTILAAEFCPYVSDETGVQKTDFVINGVMYGEWDSIVSGVVGESGINLNLQQPKDVLSVINFKCRDVSHTAGILPLLGMRNLLNLTEMLESETVQGHLNEGKGTVIEQIFAANLANYVPTNVLNELSSTLEALKGFLENYPGQVLYNQINGILKSEQEFSLLRQMIAETESTKRLLSDFDVQSTAAAVARLKGEEIGQAYMQIENGKTLPDNLNKLILLINTLKDTISSKTAITAVVDIPYISTTQNVIKEVGLRGTDTINHLTDSLLPCQALSEGVRALILMPCGPSGLDARLFAWSLLLTLAILFIFLSFVGLFNLWCIQNHQIKRFSKATTVPESEDISVVDSKF